MSTDKVEQNTLFVSLHVSGVTFVLDLLDELLQTLTFGILMVRTDKRVSALHVTVFASMLNMTGFFLHKVYIFWLGEKFGIYYPFYNFFSRKDASTLALVSWLSLVLSTFLFGSPECRYRAGKQLKPKSNTLSAPFVVPQQCPLKPITCVVN